MFFSKKTLILMPLSMKSSFLALLFHVASNKDNMYHYRHYPTSSDTWCKCNDGRARITAKLISLAQVFQKTLFKAYIFRIK